MSTLIRPPPLDPSQSAIENLLELTQLSDIDPDLFTNTRPLWHPPGARGIYGGAAIAQCLSAAQRTVPNDFTIHSMHCYFVLAGNSEIPIIYHVERVRSGKSFATRTVQARQRGKVIFTTTMSFVRENSGGEQKVEHSADMPDVPGPVEGMDDLSPSGGMHSGPFQSQRVEIFNNDSPYPHTKKTRQWIKARGQISPTGGHEAHLSALAYMSDSYFIGTIARVHKLWRYSAVRKSNTKSSIDEDTLKNLLKMDDETLKRVQFVEDVDLERLRRLRNGEDVSKDVKPEIGMMVSLDHTIYFHNPRNFRADEWMFTEMETPWAGDGRGLVYQRIFSRDGQLIASCVQEGVVRLRQPGESKLLSAASPAFWGTSGKNLRHFLSFFDGLCPDRKMDFLVRSLALSSTGTILLVPAANPHGDGDVDSDMDNTMSTPKVPYANASYTVLYGGLPRFDSAKEADAVFKPMKLKTPMGYYGGLDVSYLQRAED
ncbi:Thioesterase/thiol ester dehydrase-isomerase [Zopfia rhizophila CBS 207.26]|uniref:Thioesterase/thiol ester dehydrase-isomerase n=1 Tax=Zopfia rhizophila CBS 207.26 TaxID=1314779 RepID=A0A6A6DZ91_9PEZI|nr:Thioesterase/thiol ester dehydrase-isomerase [Zopfia rhizophila CBS 207.26]